MNYWFRRLLRLKWDTSYKEVKVTVVRIFYGGRDIEGIINANKE